MLDSPAPAARWWAAVAAGLTVARRLIQAAAPPWAGAAAGLAVAGLALVGGPVVRAAVAAVTRDGAREAIAQVPREALADPAVLAALRGGAASTPSAEPTDAISGESRVARDVSDRCTQHL